MTRKRSVTAKALLVVNAHVSMIILNRHAQICVQEAYDEAQMLLRKNMPIIISHTTRKLAICTCDLQGQRLPCVVKAV